MQAEESILDTMERRQLKLYGQLHLPRVSRQSRLSDNDKGDNERIPGAVHRSPGICLTAVENYGKPQLGDHLMKGLCDQSSSQMGSLPSKCGR